MTTLDQIIVARASGARLSPVSDIIGLVATRHGLTRAQVLAYGRKPKLAGVRHVAMYLARQHTPFPYTVIARVFRRDSTTVMHGVKQVERRMRRDREFAADIEVLNSLIGGA